MKVSIGAHQEFGRDASMHFACRTCRGEALHAWGSRQAQELAACSEDVVHLTDHFPQDAVDSEWLPFVGENQLVLVTRDEKIRWRPAEIAAVNAYKIAVFFLLVRLTSPSGRVQR